MKTRLLVLLVVFLNSVGVFAQGDPCPQPQCAWVGGGPGKPPTCQCELFIDGTSLSIAFAMALTLAFYFYSKKNREVKE